MIPEPTVAAGDPTPVPRSSRRSRHRVALLVMWVAVIGIYQVWALRNGVGPGKAVERLVDALQGSAWGPVVFAAAYLLRPLLLFSAAVLTVAAGFLFGAGFGLLLVIIVSNASAMVAYAIGRWFAGDQVLEGESGGRLAGYAERLRTRSFETTLILRLLLVPYDLVSYLAGFLRIRPLPFLAGTAVGSIPGTVAFVLAGASIDDFDGGVPSLDWRTLSASIGLLAVSLISVRVLRRRERTP